MTTLTMKGGNMETLYKGNGRLKMARALETMWPGIVQTKWRFNRPQHVVAWNRFTQTLIRRKDIDWNQVKENKYDIKLKAIDEIKSNSLKQFYQDYDNK